jgi:Putative zinc-binding metallo-peptidase
MDLGRLSRIDLLNIRFCDLPISLGGTVVEQRAHSVFEELRAREITVRPSIWLDEEWYNPDGVNGYAIPFYLAHPVLIRLEREMMLEAEGVAATECFRILRHETGHAVDEAFQLFRTEEYREVFGAPTRSYPTAYAARLRSREYVLHLNAWYAQAHPVEDFAETFAVWLRPKRLWRRQYRDWPALDKLEAVDRWMSERAGVPPVMTDHSGVAGLQSNQRTLGEHYEEKRAFYGVGSTARYDRALRKIFPAPVSGDGGKAYKTAIGFLRAVRTPLRKEVSRPLGVPAYAVDQVLRQLIHRARALNLLHTRPAEDTLKDLVRLVSRTTTELIRNAPRLPL